MKGDNVYSYLNEIKQADSCHSTGIMLGIRLKEIKPLLPKGKTYSLLSCYNS